MKTNKLNKLKLLIVVIALFISSCEKDSFWNTPANELLGGTTGLSESSEQK